MNTPALILSALGGAVLGLLFFWGLWVTVRRLQQARYPAAWMLGSLLLRFLILLGGFYLISRYGGWEHLVAAVAGLILARVLLLRRLQPEPQRGKNGQ